MKCKTNFNDPLNAAAFETSVRAKDLDTIKLLLQHKIPDSLNVKALKAAMWGKDLDMTKLLLEFSVELLDHVNNAMSLAIYDQNFSMVQLLAEHGTDVKKALKSARSVFIKSDALDQIVEFLESKLELEDSLPEHTESVDTAPVGESEIHNDAIGN